MRSFEKLLSILVITAGLGVYAEASSTRSIDADQITSPDKTKTFTFPASSAALAGLGSTAGTDVSSAAGASGSATTAARSDHTHQGVHSIASGPSGTSLYGDVHILQGNGTKVSQSGQNVTVAGNGGRTINAQTGTTYTFVLSDGASYGGNPLVTGTNSSAQSYTVPPNSSVAYPVGEQIDVCQLGTGKISFFQGSGVTIYSSAGNTGIAGQYVCVSLFQYSTNNWTLVGNLIP